MRANYWPKSGFRVYRTPILWVVVALLIMALGSQISYGQRSRAIPQDKYFLLFRKYFDGDYRDSARYFRDALRSGLRTTERRWVDSICYYTMLGESYYRMGQLDDALKQYNSALGLLEMHADWLLRIQFPNTVSPASSAKFATITWGTSRRRPVLGQIPDTMLASFGRINNEQVIRRGGAVLPPQMLSVQVGEVVRCSALAIRRRCELMGPAGAHDPLNTQIIQRLMDRPAPVNHWSLAWVDAQLGLAYAAIGDSANAMERLKKSVVVAGQYDHILTATVLLELGKLAFHQEQYEIASRFFLEATIAAVPFSQADVMEEAFRLGAITHLMSNGRGVYPPLLHAAEWARKKNYRNLQASLLILAGEGFVLEGNLSRAAVLLGEASAVIGRRQMRDGRIQARLQFQMARLNFHRGNIPTANQLLATTLAYQQKGSLWLYHVATADRMFQTSAVTPLKAGNLYAQVLREPTAGDWLAQPMETLSYCATPHVLPIEHWFLATLDRKDHELSMEVADRLRRHRFHSSLPLGGRLLAMRWVLEAPPSMLDETALLQRQDLLAKYPEYARLSRQAQRLSGDLEQLPLVPEAEEEQRELAARLADLAQISESQERFLAKLALRREPSEFVFPPLNTINKIQKQLRDGQAVISYLAAGKELYAFSLTRKAYSTWKVEAPGRIKTSLVAMLRQMGHVDRNGHISTTKLADSKWQENATDLLQKLIKVQGENPWASIDELIIVPDGLLWYVPFESLLVQQEGESHPLISLVPVRYAPTLALAVPDGRRPKRAERTAVVPGKLYNREDDEISREALDSLLDALPGSTALPAPLLAPSAITAKFWDRLIVMDDIDDRASGPYDWAPAQIDLGKSGSLLAEWFPLPWGAPQQILLPAFHTPAENGLKRVRQGTNGNEVFLSVCGLMSTGARTILLSRWRAGGQTSYDLVREFAQELPHTSAAAAWQRSVQLARQAELDPEREPRVRAGSTPDLLHADHPFFWAGHMVIDTGTIPGADDNAPPRAAVNLQAAQAE